MTTRFSHRDVAAPRSFWNRVGVALWLLLVMVSSVQQAVHSHGPRYAPHANHATVEGPGLSAPAGEADCPLCAAMHGVLPTAMFSPVAVRFSEVSLVAATEERGVQRVQSFALFSRPPPVVLS